MWNLESHMKRLLFTLSKHGFKFHSFGAVSPLQLTRWMYPLLLQALSREAEKEGMDTINKREMKNEKMLTSIHRSFKLSGTKIILSVCSVS